MGGWLGKLLGGPIKDVFGGIGDILDRFVTDPDKKLQAQLELTRIQTDAQLKLAEMDTEWAKVQGEVIKAEAQSASWLARNWRPLTMLSFTWIVVHNFILAPLFSLQSLPIPPDMWDLLKLGLGGYVIGRSVEKIAPDVARVLKK